MAYRLEMSAELGDWLAEICSSEPVTAREVGAALAALMAAADPRDLAFVRDLSGPEEMSGQAWLDPGDLRAALDQDYADLLDVMRDLRFQAADAGSFRTTTRHRITKSGSEPLPFTAEEIAAATALERDVRHLLSRYQAAADQFRAEKEAAKARYTAAEAAVQVNRALIAAGTSPDGREPGLHHSAADQAVPDLPAAEATLAAVTLQLTELRQRAALLIRLASGRDAADQQPATTEGLLELRADPLVTDVRILFAAGPPGAVTLLAVLHGTDAISEHRDQAIGLAGELLRELRETAWAQPESCPLVPATAAAGDSPAAAGNSPAAGGDSSAAELSFAGSAPFLARFFPDQTGLIGQRAADLAAGRTLHSLRRLSGLGLRELAARTGRTDEELWRTESRDLRGASLADVAAYLRGLGGRLTVSMAGDDGAETTITG